MILKICNLIKEIITLYNPKRQKLLKLHNKIDLKILYIYIEAYA